MNDENRQALYEILRSQWIEILKLKFGHRDFSVLNAKYKNNVYELVADMIMQDMELFGNRIYMPYVETEE